MHVGLSGAVVRFYYTDFVYNSIKTKFLSFFSGPELQRTCLQMKMAGLNQTG